MASKLTQEANKKAPHPVDAHVGERIRERRYYRRLSPKQLAGKIGVTYQQLHQYEAGTSRVAASRLKDIGDALGVQPAYFFEGLEQDVKANSVDEVSPKVRRKALTFSTMLEGLPPKQRAAMLALTHAIGKPNLK